ncbi:MAG: hypothetical protein ACJ77N_03570 [Chloroflexota bacterium]
MKEPDDRRDPAPETAPGAATDAAREGDVGEVVPAGAGVPTKSTTEPDRGPRPLIERLGMAAIAIVLAGLFGIVAVAAFTGGEPFLGAMGAIGCLMTLWVGGLTLLRG